MKKAQWKETPRDRAYGTPRHSDIEKLNMQVADMTTRLDLQLQKTEMWQSRVEHLKERISEQAQQLMKLDDIHRAYKFLRITGVVMEHEGEFKHLQGEDMDKFFGITQPPPEPPRGILRGGQMTDTLLQSLNTQFEKAYRQYVATGADVSHIFYDDKTDALSWQAPQKP